MNKNQNIPILENKANLLVKEVLVSEEYSEDLEIERHLLDDDRISYSIYNPICYHQKETKVLRILSCKEYKEYLKIAFENRDNIVDHIYSEIKHDKLYYYISFREIGKIKGKRRGR